MKSYLVNNKKGESRLLIEPETAEDRTFLENHGGQLSALFVMRNGDVPEGAKGKLTQVSYSGAGPAEEDEEEDDGW